MSHASLVKTHTRAQQTARMCDIPGESGHAGAAGRGVAALPAGRGDLAGRHDACENTPGIHQASSATAPPSERHTRAHIQAQPTPRVCLHTWPFVCARALTDDLNGVVNGAGQHDALAADVVGDAGHDDCCHGFDWGACEGLWWEGVQLTSGCCLGCEQTVYRTEILTAATSTPSFSHATRLTRSENSPPTRETKGTDHAIGAGNEQGLFLVKLVVVFAWVVIE